MNVQIYNETQRKRIPKKKIKDTVEKVLNHFGQDGTINLVIVGEDAILQLNKEYLGHDYITDVISFNLSEGKDLLGEVYICLQQAERQATEYNVSLENELLRLAIHGVLHILGFEDDTFDKKSEMHKLEDMFLEDIR
ncbi:MAG: Metal-dependent hydrolase YbeY, involved in rRNA and/or ribosome maturation and assembly [Candidatus Kapaibacterium sp.]|nr:MAG: Metal-dependent hydrolase YbeY, involved in rRNA and/or ribosome maturation and assembly [Candidatus Kapabacteria bacterium]